MKSHTCAMVSDDTALIENIKATGIVKRKAEDELFVRYTYLVKRGMVRYLLSEDESLDAYSDTVMAVIESVTSGTFAGRASLKTYCYQIFSNKCVDALRKRTSRSNSVNRTVELNELQHPASEPSVPAFEALSEHSARLETVKQKLHLLSDGNRQLLLLSAEGYTDREIASLLHFKTADVVKTSRLRCLKKLRQFMNYTCEIVS